MNDKELFDKYLDKVGSIKDQRYFHMNEEIFNGQESYLRMKFKGSSIFNPIWINKIEDCLYELDQITNNPREVTTSEGSVVPIELAKKINYESVQHLASHSQYIKDIKSDGDVIPAKILSLYNKEELHTYENRFIATFIRRLILFIDKRYEFIKNTVKLDEKEIMYVKNKSIVDGQEVEIESKITVTRTLEDDLTIAAKDYIARIDKLKEYVGYYYNSPFMKEFKTEKDVRRPIIQTNIIRKNPLYHKCYETFLFIEKFESLGVTFKVDRHFQEFSEKERKELSHILLSNLLFLKNTENSNEYKQTNKVYKPKLLHSIDDESFIYDELVKGPVDYVRADELYIKYLNERSPKELPDHPNKSEKQYYKEEYELKNNIDKEIKNIEALLARIRRKIDRYEKKVEKLIAQRDIDEANALKEYIKELRKEEQSILDKKREEIIAAAKGDMIENKRSKKVKKPSKQKEETPLIVEEKQVEEKPIEEQPQPVEEVTEEEPVVNEEIKEEPVIKEETPVVEETPALEEKKEEKPAKVAQKAKKKAKTDKPSKEKKPSKPKVKKEEKKEESPKPDTPKEGKKVAKKKPVEPVKDVAPVIEEAPIEEEPVKETPKKEAKPKKKKEAPKKAPVKKEKSEPKKVKKAKPAKEEPSPILGTFIVKTLDGYYVNSKKFSNMKGDAHIFHDFNKANEIKRQLGGKVVKL